MLKQFTGLEKTYKLLLSDNLTWCFKATDSITPWLDNLAEIMQLVEDNEKTFDRSLLFLALKQDNYLPDLDSSCNWKNYKQGAAYRIWSHDEHHEDFIELNLDYVNHEEIKFINMSSSLKTLFRYYVDNNGVGPIHAALAEFNRKGILIAAQGGTGKSTCSKRFPSHWNSLSDDMSLIVKTRENNYRGHPMPTWSDHLCGFKQSKFNSSYSVPLNAIFFLEQSDIDEVIPLNPIIGAQKIFESSKQVWGAYLGKIPKDEERKMIQNIFNHSFDLAKKTPCYILKATLHGEFWKEIEKVICA